MKAVAGKVVMAVQEENKKNKKTKRVLKWKSKKL